MMVGRMLCVSDGWSHSSETDSDASGDESSAVSDGSNGSTEKFHPIIGDPIRVDDSNATIVIVFPRVVEAKEVEEPLERALEVFPQLRFDAPELEALRSDSVSNVDYQNLVRKIVLRLMSESGFRVEAFKSVDRDEIFLKVGLDCDSEAIRQLANKADYKMPLAVSAYRLHSGADGKKRDKPMKDDYGRTVPAYHPYVREQDSLYAKFREVDAIRLTAQRLKETMKLHVLEEQKVVVRHFAAADFRQMEYLHERLVSFKQLFKLPSQDDLDDIRNYFGEDIAFFFHWAQFYVRMLVPMCLFTGISILRHTPGLELPLQLQDVTRLVSTIVLSIWAQAFNVMFQRQSARSVQRWGMKDYDPTTSLTLSSHNPDLDRTWKLWWMKRLVTLTTLLFCSCFVVAVLMSESQLDEERRSMVTVALIKVGSFIWGPIAGKLVHLQNHRTSRSRADALTKLLAVVKIFCALFPFLYQAFVVRFENHVCGETLEEAARALYCETGVCKWPTGVEDYGNGTWLNQSGYIWQNSWEANKTLICVCGCYPIDCQEKSNGDLRCSTTCWKSLKYNFKMLYLTHVALTLLFLLIPRVMTSVTWHWELHRAKGRYRAMGRRHMPKYTFLQWQAKHHIHAAYEYLSWGGSHPEDFLELAISFTLITCFGILYPPLSFFALLAHCVEYRLLLHRFVHITCRPFPHGSEGIGQWSSVMQAISNLSVVINVGLLIFFLDPIRHWTLKNQVIAALVLEHLLFALKLLAKAIVDHVPEDVKAIDIFNARISVWIKANANLALPASEVHKIEGVDIWCTEER